MQTKKINYLTEILNRLSHYRSLLIIMYFFVLVIFIFFSLIGISEIIPDGYFWMLNPANPDYSELVHTSVSEGFLFRVIFLAAFLGLQALFIWGGGRISISTAPVKSRKLIVSLLIISALITIISFSVIMIFLEFADQYYSLMVVSDDSNIFYRFFQSLLNEPEYVPHLVVISFTWVFWFIVSLIYLRGLNHFSALSQLIKIVLCGSWIEFVVALPVDIATRKRTEECPCISGSWLGLVFSVPILIWTIGPAIYFLYMREKRLNDATPGHARKILVRKSYRRKDQL